MTPSVEWKYVVITPVESSILKRQCCRFGVIFINGCMVIQGGVCCHNVGRCVRTESPIQRPRDWTYYSHKRESNTVCLMTATWYPSCLVYSTSYHGWCWWFSADVAPEHLQPPWWPTPNNHKCGHRRTDILVVIAGYLHVRITRDSATIMVILQWRRNGHDGVSNHQPRDCLLSRLFRRRSKETSRLRVTGLCAGNSPATGEFPRTKGQ